MDAVQICLLCCAIAAVCLSAYVLVNQHFLSLRLDQAKETAPKKQTQELLEYCATLQKEFNSLAESQEEFRERVLREANRVSSLIRRRLPDQRLAESSKAEDDEVISLDDPRATGLTGAPQSTPSEQRAMSREEQRRRIREQWNRTRGTG